MENEWCSSKNKDPSMLNVCRTCLCQRDVRPLFPQTDNYRSFERALYLSTGLRIEINDGLPQSICRKCATTVEAAMRFRATSHSAEKKLLHCFKLKKKTDPDKASYEEEVNQNNEIKESAVKDLVKYEEEFENKTVIETPLLENKCIKEDNTKRIELFGKELDSPENNIESDNEYESATKSKCTNSRPYLDLIEGPVNSKGPVICKICKKSSKCINSFEKHAMSHMGYEILCEFCARRCVSRMQLLRHQRAKHGLARDNSFACKYCDYKAIDKEQLESHERRLHTKERPFVCDECGEAFYTKRVLVQHGYRHKTDKPFQCNMCPSKFKIRSRLTSHKKFVHSKRYKYSYGCYLCPKLYKKPFEARKHIVKIHGIPKDQQNKIPRYNREDS